jgi:uncharacterized protein (DUF2384 family)
MIKKICTGLLMATLLVPSLSFAQSSSTTIDVEPIEAQTDIHIEEQALEDLPSTFDLLWLSVVERIDLWLTISEETKVEKRLEYAAKREQLAAEILASSDTAQRAAQAYRLLQRANDLAGDSLEIAKRWQTEPGVEIDGLYAKITDYYIHREQLLETLEEKIPDSYREKFLEVQAALYEDGEVFFRYVYTEHIPQDLKETIEQARADVAARYEGQAAFRAEREAWIELLRAGLSQSADDARALWEKQTEQYRQAVEREAAEQDTSPRESYISPAELLKRAKEISADAEARVDAYRSGDAEQGTASNTQTEGAF